MNADEATPPEVGSQRASGSSDGRHRRSVFRSLGFAWSGLVHLFLTQRNARIEAIIALWVLATAWWVGVSAVQWCILILTIALVLVLEALNTAIEALVDLVSPEHHPLARIIKDVSAGMVLLAAIASVAIGLLIFGPALRDTFNR